MEETTPIRAVEMVRDIRDQLASEWAAKSPAELIQILNQAGVQARDEARRGRRGTSNTRMEPTLSPAAARLIRNR